MKGDRKKSPIYPTAPTITTIDSPDTTNIVTKFAFATRVGYAANNPGKVNQDAFILAPNILNMQSMHYFGVWDGHGQNGKDVSVLIKQKLPALLEQHLFNSQLDIKKSLIQSFLDCNDILMTNKKFDVYLSGSTWWTALFCGNKIYTANWGDSRGIIVGRTALKEELAVRSATRDHKPSEEDEAKRIIERNGRIDAFKDNYGQPLGPLRVWLKNDDLPGLAMTRSMGDGCAAEAGVIPDAEIFEFELTSNDMFIVLASDGVWEFMDNELVAKIVAPFYESGSPEAAANAIGMQSILII